MFRAVVVLGHKLSTEVTVAGYFSQNLKCEKTFATRTVLLVLSLLL
jgi:hypothetical protein